MQSKKEKLYKKDSKILKGLSFVIAVIIFICYKGKKIQNLKLKLMLNPPNSLSLLRAPLAFLFLSENVTIRTISVVIALLSDCIDGYLARKYKYTSKLGAILDPLMDKFFVYFVLTVFILEGKLLIWQGILMISRDLFLCLFALYLFFSRSWNSFEFRSVRWGKITTGLQFLVIILLIYNITPFYQIYWIFTLFGFLVFLELFKAPK